MRNQRFHCPRPFQKWHKISSKKKLCNQTPLKSLIFSLRAPLDGNMSRKGFQKGSFWGGQERPKNIIFAVRSCLGARMAPKSPQASILDALLINFGSFLPVFETFFYRLVSFLSAPAVGRGSNRKQLTIHSKLNHGCDGNALHNSAQHKNEKCWWPVRARWRGGRRPVDILFWRDRPHLLRK